MTLEERLNEQLTEKEGEIGELQKRIEQLEERLDVGQMIWQIHSVFENDTFSQQMPFPRLEMRLRRINKNDWYSIEWTYGLVHKPFWSMSSDALLFIPFSRTTANGGRGGIESWKNTEGKLNLPFRDGVHIKADSLVLALPAYVICREENICQKIDISDAGL